MKDADAPEELPDVPELTRAVLEEMELTLLKLERVEVDLLESEEVKLTLREPADLLLEVEGVEFALPELSAPEL